jgi:flagellar hook-basal body complex protein FliE
MNAQFLDLVRTMYSVKRADSDLDALKTMILDKVTDAVSGALAEIGGETADEVRDKLVESFRAAGL